MAARCLFLCKLSPFLIAAEKDRFIAFPRKDLRRREADAERAAGNEDESSCI